MDIPGKDKGENEQQIGKDVMIPVSIKFTKQMIVDMQLWVNKGKYSSRSDLIKDAVRSKIKELKDDEKYEAAKHNLG